MPRLLPIKSHHNSILYHNFVRVERREHSYTYTLDDSVHKE